MDYTLKRIEAYLLDIIIVSIVAGLITYIPFINPMSEKYEETNKNITEISKKYNDHDITKKEYKKEYITNTYNMERYGISYSIVNALCLIGYFIIFQFMNKGQTLGKKMFKLKVVNKDEDTVSLGSIIIRSVIINAIYVYVLELIFVLLLNKTAYYYATSTLSTISNLIIYVSLFMIMFTKDKRGIHDILANTEVVPASIPVDNKVIEAEVVEEKSSEVEKKTTKKKTIAKKKVISNKKIETNKEKSKK